MTTSIVSPGTTHVGTAGVLRANSRLSGRAKLDFLTAAAREAASQVYSCRHLHRKWSTVRHESDSHPPAEHDRARRLYNFCMPRSMAREQDILQRRDPRRPPRLTSRRIGIHTSSAGGVQNAAERAYRLGCNTLQVFSSSPRQWAPYELSRPQCAEMSRLREKYELKPLVIHTNYLVNLASMNPLFLKKSVEAFRGEVERALDLCAESRLASWLVSRRRSRTRIT